MEKRRVVTIITESILESMLVEDLGRLGAKGCTITEARGRGARGMRSGDWDQGQNIRIEVICGEALAKTIVEHCQQQYYSNYAMVLYVSDVEVLRLDKF